MVNDDKKEAAVSKELKKPAKVPAANPAIKKAAAPGKTTKKEEKVHDKPKTKQGIVVSDGHFIGVTNSFTDPGKEKELKSPAATKDKEHAEEKDGKNPASLKQKDSLKGKNPKNPDNLGEKETGKRKDVKPPAALKEKDSSKRKEIKTSTNPKDKGSLQLLEAAVGGPQKTPFSTLNKPNSQLVYIMQALQPPWTPSDSLELFMSFSSYGLLNCTQYSSWDSPK
ncbi:triadin-like isoform X7 [Turdus rufiventris]|nr:triadin-like isoform X7 [Turdus rufiventris]